jgi:hypothetical protein
MIQAQFLGARAEAGRALNILKSTARDAERVKLVQQVVDQYGKDPAKLAAMITELDNPASALKFAKEAVKATTWEKIVEAWKAGLLSGARHARREHAGQRAFLALRAPIDAVAAGVGMLRGARRRSRLATEPIARAVGAIAGSMDAVKMAGHVLRTGEIHGQGRGHATGGAIEGVKGEVIRLPFRFLSAEDAFFKTLNERGELYALATRQATGRGLQPAHRRIPQPRGAARAASPTEEMAAARRRTRPSASRSTRSSATRARRAEVRARVAPRMAAALHPHAVEHHQGNDAADAARAAREGMARRVRRRAASSATRRSPSSRPAPRS